MVYVFKSVDFLSCNEKNQIICFFSLPNCIFFVFKRFFPYDFQHCGNTLRSTYLHKAHTDGTHLGELIDSLEAVVDGLGQKLGKLLVVENLQAAFAGDLTHGRRMEAMVIITITALDEDTAVAQTFCVHLPAHVIEMDT